MDNQKLLAQIFDFVAALFAIRGKESPPKMSVPSPRLPPQPEIKTAPKVEVQKISAKELNPHGYATSSEIDANLAILLQKINIVRNAYDSPMIVASGLRSEAHQAKLIADGLSKATKSNHLAGRAVDIKDKDGKLKAWVLANVGLMEEIGFWFEDFSYTPTWVHFQINPPKSGKRFYIPY